MLESEIQVRTYQFDGPLSLLLILIEKEEMDIRDLDINIITAQYLKTINQMQVLNFDMAGDFLFMASTLLFLKSASCIDDDTRDLLSQNAQEAGMITSRADLIFRLEELQRFQRLGGILWELPKLNYDTFVRPRFNRKNLMNSLLLPMDLNSLTGVMADFIARDRKKITIIHRDVISVKQKLSFLRKVLEIGKTLSFLELLDQDEENKGLKIQNKVVTFISLLELARLQKISILQHEDLQDIYVSVLESLTDFNMELVDNFEYKKPETAAPLDAPIQ
jgi:segregation and condensation protein A